MSRNLIEARLIEALSTDQRREIENIRAAAERIWARPLHRYYTDHTISHSERIITRLDGLTAGMMATDKRLNRTEIFILLAAAYLHDIGMQNERFAGGDLEQIREEHNEQSAEMIYAVFENPTGAFPIAFPDQPTLVEAVALVSKGHRRVDLAGLDYEPLPYEDGILRLRLLAALLRFGDELDIDHRRVDMEMIKLAALPTDSQLHWWKCYYVSGVSIVDEYIRVAYRFPQARPDYAQLIIPLVEDEIRAKRAALEPIFWGDGVKVALGPPQVRPMRLIEPMPAEVEAEARGYTPAKDQTPVQTEVREVTDITRPIHSGPDPITQTKQTPQPSDPTTPPDLTTIQEAVSQTFGDPALVTFCYDHYRPVYDRFSAATTERSKIRRLVNYCRDQGAAELERLWRLVTEAGR